MKRTVLAGKRSRSNVSSVRRSSAGTRKAGGFVLCTDNSGYEASLERMKVYRRMDDRSAEKHGQIRVVDESGDDYLYESAMFARITIPESARKAVAAAL